MAGEAARPDVHPTYEAWGSFVLVLSLLVTQPPPPSLCAVAVMSPTTHTPKPLPPVNTRITGRAPASGGDT